MPILLLAFACAPLDEGKGPDPATAQRRGLLQFHTEHNLEDDSCLADGDCFLELEETEDVDGWISALETRGNTPVLHLDVGVPWSAVAVATPDGEDPHAFYADRLDPELLARLQAYADWFDTAGRGYLAISVLGGTRDRLASELLTDGETEEVGEVCPDLGPDATFVSADGTPFTLGDAWLRWAEFLIAELGPDQIALLVEANLFEVACPDRWPSLVSLYQSTYDAVRPGVGDDVELFATLSLPPLLGWDDSCVGDLSYVTCEEEPPTPATIDPDACYPGDPSALEDLAEGDRMDVLALSVYPDGLPMAPAGVEDARMRLYLDTTEPSGDCDLQARMPAWVDPLDHLDRLGWDGPIGLAETSARSCPTLNYYDDGATQAAVELPGSDAGQVAWVGNVVARPELSFVYQSFLRDYPPLGLWLATEGVLEPAMLNTLNLWPCSGLESADGTPKDADAVWQGAIH